MFIQYAAHLLLAWLIEKQRRMPFGPHLPVIFFIRHNKTILEFMQLLCVFNTSKCNIEVLFIIIER